jgi:heterodisulfide reductase subunit A-like polyferredoxin
MHEKTFRRACGQAGLNAFMCEMANIREHCSWIHEDRGEATAKAIGHRPHDHREGQLSAAETSVR